jgi:hypothetical protein
MVLSALIRGGNNMSHPSLTCASRDSVFTHPRWIPRNRRRFKMPFFAAVMICAAISARSDDMPSGLSTLCQGGPLNIDLRTDTGRDVHLEWDTFYITQTLGARLSTEQIEKLDLLRTEAPEKFGLLQHLYPQQFAEYFLRTKMRGVSAIPTQAANAPITLQFAPADFDAPELSRRAPAVAVRSGKNADPDFESPRKAEIFRALKKQYSPFRSIGMTLVGDTLSIDGKIITETLRADAAAAGKTPEEYADARYARAREILARQMRGEIRDRACAATMLAFLKDSRLASFTTAEKQQAFRRIFGRDLQSVAEEAERKADEIESSENFPRLSQLR